MLLVRGLAGLPRLQSLCWEGELPPAADPALPHGPWLASLQRLRASPEMLLASSELLAAQAPRLECLAVSLQGSNPQHQALMLGAASWPALRRLITDAPESEFRQAAVMAQRINPELNVQFVPAERLSSAVLAGGEA